MSAEYVDDVPYIRQFAADLSPSRLRLAAALNWLTPPPIEDFDYCELGCAHGDTLAALAAAHPTGRFLGVDLNATHIASAKRLARDGALENIGVLERDFSALVDEDIGEFDYVVAHGVLSWVSPSIRKALIDFAAQKLKPGGLLHVSYNAMPGWASVEPLRQLLLAGGAGGDTTLERARRGLEFAQAMQRAGAEYFAKTPAASEMLATMVKVGLPYVVHEYLHEHWAPMYFARVAWEMAASDLHFVGVLPPHMNDRNTAIPEAVERLLATVTERTAFESLKDFAVDEFFRRDVYVKGTHPRAASATEHYLESTLWGTLASAPPADRTVKLPHRTLTFDGAMFDAIFAALAEGTTTLAALASRRELAAVSREELRAALRRLILAEHAVPMCREARVVPASAEQRFTLPSVYNQMMLRRLSSEMPILMVSNIAGSAFAVSALEGLVIRMLTEVAAPERDRWIDELVGRSVLRIRIGDQVLAEPPEQRRAIRETYDRFCAERLAKVVELGILRPNDRAS
ncbi:MAG: Methyltransferase [Labilithrix sp.]|nr:Methyltransferase [Labilithrix sp.]